MATPLFDASTPEFVELLAACPVVAGAIVSKPLLNLPEGKVVLFAMDAGQEISEHRAPLVSTVHVIDGRLPIAAAPSGSVAARRAGLTDALCPTTAGPHQLRPGVWAGGAGRGSRVQTREW